MRGNQTHALETAPAGAANGDALQPSYDPKLGVTVIHTTPEGTVVALRAGADLVKHLDGRLTLFAPEVVPFLLPLEEPNVAIDFMKKRYRELVASAGIVDQDVTIRILLCRDRAGALKQALAPHSLIVVGGSTRWWRRAERKLAHWLQTQGHHVVFVDLESNERTASEAGVRTQAAFSRVLQKETRGVGR
jgi:hypothetical protein